MKPVQSLLRTQMFLLVLLAFFTFSYPFKTEATYISWSGSGRLEAFYHSEKTYYSDLFFILNSHLYIQDNLSIHARFDLKGLPSSSPWEGLVENSSLLKQGGYVFLDSKNSSSFPFFLPTQFYLDYASDFLKIRVGRAPYHFALGTTYYASDNPLDRWMTVQDQISIYMIYENFYVQPAVFYNSSPSDKHATALLEGGIDQEKWNLAFLYEYKFKKETTPLAEIYGKYEKNRLSLSSAVSYLFNSENSFALALEALYDWPLSIPLELGLKAGALNNKSQFHPQYHLTLFPQDYFAQNQSEGNKQNPSDNTPQKTTELKSSLQNSLYVSPSVSVSFFKESLKLKPQFLFAYPLTQKASLRSDLYLEGFYQAQENILFRLQGGLIYQKKWSFSLLAQTAVNF